VRAVRQNLAARCTPYSAKRCRAPRATNRLRGPLQELVEDSNPASWPRSKVYPYTPGLDDPSLGDESDLLLLPSESPRSRRECDLSNDLRISPTTKASEVKPGLNSWYDKATVIA